MESRKIACAHCLLPDGLCIAADAAGAAAALGTECFCAEPATAVPFFIARTTSSLLIRPPFEVPGAI